MRFILGLFLLFCSFAEASVLRYLHIEGMSTATAVSLAKYGYENINEIDKSVIQVVLHKLGSAPRYMINNNRPISGYSEKIEVCRGSRSMILRYLIYFSEGFDFALGGKMPGLYLGSGRNVGGIISGETVFGFSARPMWLGHGGSGLYVYSGANKKFGITYMKKSSVFLPDKWYKVSLASFLENGRVTFSYDIDGIFSQSVDGLSINLLENDSSSGVLFDVFYGGEGDQYGPKEDATVRIKNIELECQ